MPTPRGMDFLAWVLGAIVVSGVVLFLTSLVITYYNLGSRNIVLGTGALAGAIFAFGVLLWFELRPSSRDDQVSFAYTADFKEKQIRQWDYTKVVEGDGTRRPLDLIGTLVSSRIGVEVEAGQWMFSQHQSAVEQSFNKVASDFAVFSLVEFFANAGADWQWQYRRYNSPTIPFASIAPMSSREQCSVITGEDLRRQLSDAGNLFADSPPSLFLRDVCLPVGATMQLGPREIVVQNRILRIAFSLEDPRESGDHMEPPAAGSLHRHAPRTPKLDDGSFRYDTRVQSFLIKTTFFASRAYHRDRPTLEAWSARLVEMIKAWFACC